MGLQLEYSWIQSEPVCNSNSTGSNQGDVTWLVPAAESEPLVVVKTIAPMGSCPASQDQRSHTPHGEHVENQPQPAKEVGGSGSQRAAPSMPLN